jgi:hypothetical protein
MIAQGAGLVSDGAWRAALLRAIDDLPDAPSLAALASALAG